MLIRHLWQLKTVVFLHWGLIIDIERPKIDCLSFVMYPPLAQLKIGFFSSFFAAAVYSTNEANKAGLKQSIFLYVYGSNTRCSIIALKRQEFFPLKLF